MHDRQIIGIAEVNVQFGHGLAQKGGREKKKKSAAGHPYKCDVSCTNRFQCVMWPWVTTNCISSFHHNIQPAKRDHREPVCLQAVWQPPTGLDSRYCYDESWAHAFDLSQWSHANVWALGKSYVMQIAARVTQTETAWRDDGGVEYLFIIRSANLQQMLPEKARSRRERTNPISARRLLGVQTSQWATFNNLKWSLKAFWPVALDSAQPSIII